MGVIVLIYCIKKFETGREVLSYNIKMLAKAKAVADIRLQINCHRKERYYKLNPPN